MTATALVAWLFAIGSAFFFAGCLINLWMALR